MEVVILSVNWSDIGNFTGFFQLRPHWGRNWAGLITNLDTPPKKLAPLFTPQGLKTFAEGPVRKEVQVFHLNLRLIGNFVQFSVEILKIISKIPIINFKINYQTYNYYTYLW